MDLQKYELHYDGEENQIYDINNIKNELEQFLDKLNVEEKNRSIEQHKSVSLSESTSPYYYIINESDVDFIRRLYVKFADMMDELELNLSISEETSSSIGPEESTDNLPEIVEMQRKLIKREKAMYDTSEYVLRELKSYQAGTEEILAMIAEDGLEDGTLNEQQYNDFIKTICPTLHKESGKLLLEGENTQNKENEYELPTKSFLDEEDELFEVAYNGIEEEFGSNNSEHQSKLEPADYEKLVEVEAEVAEIKEQLQEFKNEALEFEIAPLPSEELQMCNELLEDHRNALEAPEIPNLYIEKAIIESEISLDKIMSSYNHLKSKNSICEEKEAWLLKMSFVELQVQLKKLEVLCSIISSELKVLCGEEQPKYSRDTLLELEKPGKSDSIEQELFESAPNTYIRHFGSVEELVEYVKQKVDSLMQITPNSKGHQEPDNSISPAITASNTADQQEEEKLNSECFVNQQSDNASLQGVLEENSQISCLISSTSVLNNDGMQISEISQSTSENDEEFQRTIIQLLEYMNNEIVLCKDKLRQYECLYLKKVQLLQRFNLQFMDILTKYEEATSEQMDSIA